MVARHIQRHGGDPQQSLAALSATGPVHALLDRITDDEVQASLDHLGTTCQGTEGDSDSPRTATFDGDTCSAGGRFRILRFHAEGGLGRVFIARDEELRREVALKQIRDQHADDPQRRVRFLVEAEITGGLEHPGIVPVYGLGTYDDGRPYYAMRFIKGDSLKHAVAQYHREAAGRDAGERAVELRRLLGRFLDVCNAIAYAHSRGVLHRDLKPGNIMLGKYGETLVVDWGLAKSVDQPEVARLDAEPALSPESGSGVEPTEAGTQIGTPAYMSPEQAAGRLDLLGPRSDIYSLGATLYHLLTGRAPWHEEPAGEILRKVVAGEITRPRSLDPRIAPELEAICLKAMAREPEDRYATPRELADDIEAWLADEPVSAWREPWRVRTRRWMRRHRTLVTSAAVALGVAVAGLAVTLALQVRANTRERAARQLAQARYALARRVVEAYYTGASEDVLLKQPELEGLRNKLLRTALDFYREMADNWR
jgi:serine/threonine-protein kinase